MAGQGEFFLSNTHLNQAMWNRFKENYNQIRLGKWEKAVRRFLKSVSNFGRQQTSMGEFLDRANAGRILY